MTDNKFQLKAIAALTALRTGADSDFVSDLLADVVPSHFFVPADASPEETARAVLEQVSQPFNALVTGFIAAFQTVADAYDQNSPQTPAQELLQNLALALDDIE
ncbi:hypothetical protein J7E97_34890 [Streptomyces sp. ISL-66]|uniref:hypothetical protein n=1 Tax=Streptomyces sp. ISL-66 TaxID=2819186 RepID=UPI001BEAEFA9|nr:hypothetical protein [Streptomyces sp. ISL-66]MBT2472899.1 hypothetical protein [Streptomyces sp. ISL-66]